ncbi:LOW QUALITY PROTEIN: cGMP-specific 3',5'-cyclic phosphodiesterase-like [Penaeus monodon]|uniref:LOW QUALITY PROTEIN: cGMP-specific 3',5'-cyclic phosphodiesterase-like n=1 Tax=Penaeus monodon TaxID=6687 RepID=UPI0018A6F138|nr:LOW QUALITY PROTEIN: cGMP-specific 3',5'-cyclic phosphodiesterase-like [Penaeus monodon]
MEGRAEPDGASSDQAASQRHAPSPGDAAEHVRELAGVPRADSSSTAVTHNGRVYVHYSTQPRSQAMDAADLAPETDSLAEDTESSTTTVVCDSRFFCATPDLPEQPDSLDPDCEMDARPDSSGSAQSLSPGPSASGGNSPEPDAAELGQNSHAARRSPSAAPAPKKAGAETETRVFSPSPLTSPPPDAEGELSPLPHNSVTTDERASVRSSSPSFSSGMSASSGHAGTPDLPEEQVSAYLDRHPHVVEKWLRERAPKSAFRSLRSGRSHLQADRSWDSEGPSSATPTDSQHLVANYSYPSRKNSISSWLSPKSKRSKKVERLTEPELFMELIRDISTELDIDTLCHKILVNVGHLTHADRASLFLAQGPRHSRLLVAKLFDVTVDTVLEEALSNAADREIMLPWGVGIVGHVASTKEVINIKDAYQDPRFDASIDRKTGYRTMSVLCMPVCNYEGEVIGVAEIINKKNGTNEFTPQDVEVFRRYLTFCGIGIQNAQLSTCHSRGIQSESLLLQLARGIFEEQTSLDRLVTKIMTEARELLKCERCSVFLLDPQMKNNTKGGSSLPNPGSPESENENGEALVIRQSHPPPPDELMRIPVETLTVHMAFELQSRNGECRVTQPSGDQASSSFHARLANYVCSTGQTVNINNVVEWLGSPLEDSGMVTHSVLTIPIFNSSKKILGVAQLINKENGLHFTEHDINTFEAFAIFCGLGIQNTQVYEKACRLMARQQVALECLSYHATASQEDTDKLRTVEIPSAADFDLYNFDFCDTFLTDDETLKCAIRMFVDLDLLNTFHISYEVICRWLLSVKKNYRPVKYHNWRHALTVCQTMFAMLKTGKMEQFMTDLEMLGLLVACLCHDLDHRGTNNSFQTKTDSPLAILYSTSTMEHHHFDQCVMILSQDSNNIFQSLPGEEYRKVMTVVENAILSTDMAMYFKKKDDFLEMSDNGEFDWQSDEKKQLLCGMMMTACDVSAIAKPWEIQHKTAKLVADEFFEQGDLERLKLNEQPIAMMDREKKDELPKMQVGFITSICLPLYKALSESFPWVKPLYDGCARNQEQWKRLAEQVDMGLTWIDHEYIEKPVERHELEVISKITLNPKPASQGTPPPPHNKAEGGGKGRLGLSSALRGARALKGGGKRRSVEKRLDRVMDSSHEQRPARMSPKDEAAPSTPLSEEPSQQEDSVVITRGKHQGKACNKLRSRLCVLL